MALWHYLKIFKKIYLKIKFLKIFKSSLGDFPTRKVGIKMVLLYLSQRNVSVKLYIIYKDMIDKCRQAYFDLLDLFRAPLQVVFSTI